MSRGWLQCIRGKGRNLGCPTAAVVPFGSALHHRRQTDDVHRHASRWRAGREASEGRRDGICGLRVDHPAGRLTTRVFEAGDALTCRDAGEYRRAGPIAMATASASGHRGRWQSSATALAGRAVLPHGAGRRARSPGLRAGRVAGGRCRANRPPGDSPASRRRGCPRAGASRTARTPAYRRVTPEGSRARAGGARGRAAEDASSLGKGHRVDRAHPFSVARRPVPTIPASSLPCVALAPLSLAPEDAPRARLCDSK